MKMSGVCMSGYVLVSLDEKVKEIRWENKYCIPNICLNSLKHHYNLGLICLGKQSV